MSDMLTPWGEALDQNAPWAQYPRPQLTRENWTNLNGRWAYAVTDLGQHEPPANWDGEILVPFALEAPLSGVRQLLEPSEALWYRRTFDLATLPTGRRLRHFGAVDFVCRVWVNGREVGGHRGGNLPFGFDITDALKLGENVLLLRVVDPTDGFQLKGKQRLSPARILYTRVSGIWQTVWLEPVPDCYVESLKITTQSTGRISITPKLAGTVQNNEQLRVVAKFAGHVVGQATAAAGGTLTLQVDEPKLWSPDSPHLYDLAIELLNHAGQVIDRVGSYTALREVGKARDAAGRWQFTLNGKPVFHWGPLDQGWWPDGLLTPPSEEAMVSDVQFLKAAGFNMVRKHVKVEPARFYYDCDRLGLLVWQDHVSGGPSPQWKHLHDNPQNAPAGTPMDADDQWPDDEHAFWLEQLQGMVDHLGHFPCIVVWVPFNERWGQHRTIEVGRWLADYDPTRQVNIASGGNFFPVGDIADNHRYPEPSFDHDDPQYAEFIHVVGEFGGHGLIVEGHLWQTGEKNWGYGDDLPRDRAELLARYRRSIDTLAQLKARGVAGGVYTQTTDVEGEINGLLTYDRRVQKISAQELHNIHEVLRQTPEPPPTVSAAGA